MFTPAVYVRELFRYFHTIYLFTEFQRQILDLYYMYFEVKGCLEARINQSVAQVKASVYLLLTFWFMDNHVQKCSNT